MDPSSPDYKKLFQEADYARQEAERGRQQESKRREDAERAWHEAESALQEAERGLQETERAEQELERAKQETERARQQRKDAERPLRKTTLPEYLDACHTHLYSNLTIQTDSLMSTYRNPSNAENKIRPEKLCFWDNFADQQSMIWETLVESGFMVERHFISVHVLREIGENISRRKMSSELDVHYFERETVDDHVTRVIRELHGNTSLRSKFNLRGSVAFENHSNTLSADKGLEDDVSQMSLSTHSPKISPKLLEQSKEAQTPPTATSATRSKHSRPLADQFCVYNISTGSSSASVHTPVFIVEYKAPHKLTLGHIYEGLEDVDLDDVVSIKDTDGTKEHCRRLVAAVIVQAFSYMISAGVRFGCVRTGEASIFLKVPDDPRTVFYFLSVPKEDVGKSTGWDATGNSPNRLHVTAVGQAVAFTLQALRKLPRSQSWRDSAKEQLPKWNIVFDDLVEAVPAKDAPSSEYRPSRHIGYLRKSPIRLRHRMQQELPTCQTEDRANKDDSESDASDAESPSRRLPQTSRSARATVAKKASSTSRKYCSHQCLLGLLAGVALDANCPNAQEHGRDCHQLDQQTFLVMVQRQLRETMDENFVPIGRPGSRGVPFMVNLESYGYTLVAKCTPPYLAKYLDHERAVYSHLRPIQGIHIPVNLGTIELPRPYYYEGIVDLTHAMFLSYGGMSIGPLVNATNYQRMITQIENSVSAIHNLQVRHKDVLPRNVLQHPTTKTICIVDFERAQLQPSRPAFGVISPNGKRRRDESGFVKAQPDCERLSQSEMGGLIAELLHLINRPSR